MSTLTLGETKIRKYDRDFLLQIRQLMTSGCAAQPKFPSYVEADWDILKNSGSDASRNVMSGRDTRRSVMESVDQLPSKCYDEYWIYAQNEDKRNREESGSLFVGKWLIFREVYLLDAVWQQIKEATDSGRLGQSTKCGTMKKNPLAWSSKKVICVYTYNHHDELDVFRVREELRDMGFLEKLCYKTDDATRARMYRALGSGPVGKYYA